MLPIPAYIVSAFVLIGLAFVTFRIFVRRSYRQKGRLTRLSSFFEFLVFFLFATFTWLDLPPGWPPAYVNPILRTIGWICIAIGLSGMFSLIFWFGWIRAMGHMHNIFGEEYSGTVPTFHVILKFEFGSHRLSRDESKRMER